MARRAVRAGGRTRIADYRRWIEAELAKDNEDVGTFWTRLRESDLQISEWHGSTVYAFAPTGSGAADYVQIRLGREVEWRAGPIVNPSAAYLGDLGRAERIERLAGPAHCLVEASTDFRPKP